MADPQELYRAGKLADAIAEQTTVVRSKPADHPARLFLFELLAFAGEWEKAGKQIDALTVDDPDLQLAALDYRNCVRSEQERAKVLAGQAEPLFFGETGAACQTRLQAFKALATGDSGEFARLLGEANGSGEDLQGQVNGKPFTLWRDADDLFAGVLEVFAKGRYYWVPFRNITQLSTNPPRFPRDILWMPANLSLDDGSTGAVFLPALYAGSSVHGLETVRLGRERDWMPAHADQPGILRGFGPRVYLAGEGEENLSDVRELSFGN
jgi:type VI secretion system protein ImpE